MTIEKTNVDWQFFGPGEEWHSLDNGETWFRGKPPRSAEKGDAVVITHVEPLDLQEAAE